MSDRLGPYLLGPNDTPENGIYVGDSRILAKAIPDESVDLIVTDPPYFLPVQTYVGTREHGWARRTLADMSVLQTYFDVMFEEIFRTLKRSGSAYVFCDGQSYPIMYRAMYCHFKYVRPLIWDKIVSYNGYTWRHQHELIAWGEGYEAERIPTGDGDVLSCRGVLQKDRHHAAEKPIELMMRLIEKHRRGDIIADFYVGSGPTVIAAHILGRRYLAFEIDPDVAETARQRVRESQAPLPGINVEQGTLISCE